MHAKSGVVMLACGLMLAGCSRQHEQAADATSQAMETAPAAAPAADAIELPAANVVARRRSDSPAVAASMEEQLQSAAASQEDAERKFIRTATAEFQVREVYRSAVAIEDLVAQHGGFVVKNDIRAEVDDVRTRSAGGGNLVELATYIVRGQLQVRVPSARTQAFLRALASQAEFLDNRTFSATDAQFELLRQQLAYDRHQRAQGALGDVASGRGKVGDKAQAVEARTQSQGQRDEALIARRTLEDRIAFATLDLSLYQAPRVRRSERPDIDAVVRRDGPGFFPRLGHAMSEGWLGLLDVAVALARLWPLWIVLLAGAVVVRGWRRR
jgi:hypothetical protein